MYTPTIPLKDLVHVEFGDALSITEQLKKALTLACSDGNMNKNKYKITFQSTNGILGVDATIWMVGKNYILLKGNVFIPIKSIISIR
jgi:hypothetical protein